MITDKVSKPTPIIVRPSETLDMGEYPFLTLTKYPSGFVQHIGMFYFVLCLKKYDF